MPQNPMDSRMSFLSYLIGRFGEESILPQDIPAAPATFTVTFNPNGGTVSPATRKVTIGAKVGALPTPKRSGYKFKGWYTAKSGGTKVSASTKMPAKNMTYYAQWKKK
jgi:uncharacterized repeat protein (TIGR02543 family)